MFFYIVFIMDVYSRKIVGFSVADNMRAENNVNALKMAFKVRNTHKFTELMDARPHRKELLLRQWVQLITTG